MMPRLLNEMNDDVRFIKSHTLQPRWYKVLKVFILLGFLVGHYAWAGLAKTLVFLACFLFLSLLVHMVYRVMTHKFQRSWLDFVVVEVEGQAKPKSIGIFYYAAILINALISILVSQVAVK